MDILTPKNLPNYPTRIRGYNLPEEFKPVKWFNRPRHLNKYVDGLISSGLSSECNFMLCFFLYVIKKKKVFRLTLVLTMI